MSVLRIVSKVVKQSLITVSVAGSLATLAAPLHAQESWNNGLRKIGLLTGRTDVLWPPPHQQDSLARERSAIEAAHLSARQIREVQQQLEVYGHDVGEINGQWNQQTQSAIRNFQKAQGIQVSGQLDARTITRLGLDTDDFRPQEPT